MNDAIEAAGGAPEALNARRGSVGPGLAQAAAVEARTEEYLGAQPDGPDHAAERTIPRLGYVKQAFRLELDPNDRERWALASHAGGSRYAWNWGRDRVTDAIARKAAGETVRLPNAMALNKEWNEWKKTSGKADWWPANSKCVYQEAFRDLEAALKAHWESRDGRRKGERVGFPRFKYKGRSPDKFRLYGTFYVHHRHVYLPRLGAIRIKESGSKLAEGISAGMIGIKSASIRREADRWFVSFQVQALRPEPAGKAAGPHIGIDVGLSTFATLSDGRSLESPKALASNLRKLRRLSRQHSRTQKDSARRRKAALRLARHHMKIRNIRRDHLHKVTTELPRAKVGLSSRTWR